MATERDFEGKDLAEALHHAAEAMGIAEPDLHYRIIEQGRRGLFGLGAKSVRIRVMPPVEQPPVPRVAGDLNLDQPERRPEKKPERSGGRKRRRSGGRKRDKGGERTRPERAGQSRNPAPRRADDPERPAAAPVELSAEGREIEGTVGRMFDLMGFDLQAEVVPLDGGIEIRLGGPDKKLLTQKDGELLSATQFLLNRMARRSWPDTGRIQLSCDGQKRRRDTDVVELTREVAQQVERTGRTKRLHPMNAYERRLVHITVREFGQLGSRSEGSGHLKRVKIYRSKEAAQSS